jgi:hypothetical protein
MDDQIYMSLVDYAANEARIDISRLSISRALQKLMQQKLGELNFYPPKRLERVPPLLRARGRLGTRTDSSNPVFTEEAFESSLR